MDASEVEGEGWAEVINLKESYFKDRRIVYRRNF